MRKALLIACLLSGVVGSASAQRDDLYFVPKKKKAVKVVSQQTVEETETFTMAAAPVRQLEIDEDAYNRRGAYRAEQGDAIGAENIVVITEDGDTMRMDTDTLRLTRAVKDEGWVGGFDGSDSDYEYAMRIVRFRNPRYAIPVSSPLYWDVVYGGALWPSWDWNIYDDGMYAYVFPTSSNWYYWDYRMNYPFGWSAWSNPWAYHHGYHWGHHWGGHYYSHLWYDPWCSPHFHGYHPGWHHGPHHAMHPGIGHGKPRAYPNHRTAAASTSTRRIDNGSSRNTSVSNRTSGNQVIRRSTGSSSVSRSTATGGSSRTTSRSSYDRPSSTRSSSSSVSRGSSSSRSSSSSVGRSSSSSSRSSSSSVGRSSSSSSRSGSYSSGSSSSSRGSSRSSSSFSSGGSSRSSSYSSGGSRGGNSYNGSSSSRSSGGRR